MRLCSYTYQESDWSGQEQDKREFECMGIAGRIMYVCDVDVFDVDHDSRTSTYSMAYDLSTMSLYSLFLGNTSCRV
jgi:hypothetical protein